MAGSSNNRGLAAHLRGDQNPAVRAWRARFGKEPDAHGICEPGERQSHLDRRLHPEGLSTSGLGILSLYPHSTVKGSN